jgi:hypothetical protein
LVDALVSGTSGASREGSSPFLGTSPTRSRFPATASNEREQIAPKVACIAGCCRSAPEIAIATAADIAENTRCREGRQCSLPAACRGGLLA